MLQMSPRVEMWVLEEGLQQGPDGEEEEEDVDDAGKGSTITLLICQSDDVDKNK